MWLALRFWLGRRLFSVIGDRTYPAGIRISPGRVVKWPCEMSEMDAQCYIAKTTSIPVPKVYRTHLFHGGVAIEMEFMRGTSLYNCWTSLTIDEKSSIMQQLRFYVKQLRALKPPKEDVVASTHGGPCREIRVGYATFGPFDTPDAFHACLRGGISLEGAKETFGKLVSQCHARKYSTRFTHGDLAVQNILVRGGTIVAILDWECAGWYPEYWEYTKAHYNRYNIPDFYEMIGEQMTRYDDELAAERSMWRIFDQPLDQSSG